MVQNQNNEQSQNQEQKDLHNSPKIFKIKRWKFIIFLIAIILITVILTVLSTIAISHKMSGLDADQRKSFKKLNAKQIHFT